MPEKVKMEQVLTTLEHIEEWVKTVREVLETMGHDEEITIDEERICKRFRFVRNDCGRRSLVPIYPVTQEPSKNEET